MSFSKAGASAFIDHFDGLPTDVQKRIIRKLALDRSSYLAWSFARRKNLQEYKDPSLWRSLMEAEGRHVPMIHALKPGKLLNIYHRRLYYGVMTDGEHDIPGVNYLHH